MLNTKEEIVNYIKERLNHYNEMAMWCVKELKWDSLSNYSSKIVTLKELLKNIEG